MSRLIAPPRSLRFLPLLLVLTLCATASFAQAAAPGSIAGAIAGTVSDVSGAALPGVTVTLTGNGASRTGVTNATGNYQFAELPAGDYRIAAELWGFTPASKAPIAVTASAMQQIDLTLAVAALAESVTVYGERSSRSLKETASSVAVLDELDMESRPLIASATDLLSRIPNLTSTGTDNFAPAVRGADGTGPAQGADAFFAGTRPRLNIQIDGRPASYNEVVFGDVALWDVAQVEIFRGAQSTLQGRNAVAGAVMLKTNDPTFEFESKVRVVGGGDDTRQVAGVVSGPIVDDQVAYRLAFEHSESNSFIAFTGFPGVSDPGDFRSTTLRGKLLLKPKALEGMTTLVTLTHAKVASPQTETVTRPFDDTQASYPNMPVFEPATTGAVLETRWDLHNGLTYEHTLSLTSLEVARKAMPGDGNVAIDGRELMFEPRLRFTAMGDRVRGFGGIYLFRAKQDESIDLFGGGTFDDQTTTAAAFGETSLSLSRTLSLVVGGRYEQEHRRRTGGVGPFAIDFDETYRVFSPKLNLRWDATEHVGAGVVVTRAYNGGGAGFTYDSPFVSYTFDPEYVWTTEGYVRADLGKVALTGNAFFSRYENMQLPFDLNTDPDIWSFVIRNADEAETYGAELTATWLALPGLELFSNVGLLKTKITRYRDSGIEGNELPQSPAYTLDFGGSYQLANGFDVSADGRYSDAYYSAITNDPRGKTDPHFLVNAQVGYSFSRARVFAFVHNVFDDRHATMIEPGATPADDTATILRPRRAGLGVTLSF